MLTPNNIQRGLALTLSVLLAACAEPPRQGSSPTLDSINRELDKAAQSRSKPPAAPSDAVSRALLPPTLVVHHRQDKCWLTSPAGVAPFIAWSKGKAKVVWLDGGEEVGNPCEAKGYHGFAGIDQKVVEAVAAFAR
jgi:hypothetical protein